MVLDCGWKEGGLGLKGEKGGQKGFCVVKSVGTGGGVR